MTLQFSILHVFFFCNVLTNWGQIWFISVIDHLLLAWRLPPKNAAFFWSMSTWRNFRAAEKRQSSRVPLASLLLCSLKQPYVCLLASWCQKQQWWLKTQIFHFSHSTSWKSTLKDHLCWEIFKALSCLNPEPEKEYNSYIQIDHPVPNTLNFLANLYFSSCKLFSKHSNGSQ